MTARCGCQSARSRSRAAISFSSTRGNAGSIIAFRVGAEDAVALAPELGIESPSALCDLPNYEAWARLIRDGNPTDAIRLSTEVPDTGSGGHMQAVIARTRARYTRPRGKVEREVERFIANPRPLS